MKIILIVVLILSMFIFLGASCEENGIIDDPDVPVDPIDPNGPVDPDDPIDPEWEDIMSYLEWFDTHSEELNVLLEELSIHLNDYNLGNIAWINATINKMEQIELKIEEAREQESHELFDTAYAEYLIAMDFYEEGISIVKTSIEKGVIDLIFEADLKFDQGDEHFKESLRLHLEGLK
jgi:hypothetical protein